MRVRPVRPVFTGAGGAVDFDSLRGVFFMSDLRKAAEMAYNALSRVPAGPIFVGEIIDALRAALAQPEQLVVGGDDLPTLTKWTPMAEYAAKSAAVPGRAEALKQAGYTRRPRQLPKEDEQEPVAWKVLEDTGVSYLSSEPPHPSVVAACRPLYTAPPQRQPLTVDQIYEVLGYGARAQYSSLPQYAIECVRAIEKAHGIGGEA